VALIVPHAGFVYSGAVAAAAFRQLRAGQYDVVVIISCDHQEPVSRPVSVWAEGAFQTPLGLVPVDAGLAQELMAADRQASFDPAAYEGEHTIEIELPFVQRACPACRIVPVLVGSDREDVVQALSDALLGALAGRRAVVIASSDLSHYPTYEDARTVDGATLAAIQTGDPARLHETTDSLVSKGYPNLVTCASSEAAIRVAMRVAHGLGADAVTLLRYANSGDVPQGSHTQVVGYGAVMFWHRDLPELTAAQRGELLMLARQAIVGHLKSGRIPEYQPSDAALTIQAGAFVTLKEDGRLRGCIGLLRPEGPLYRTVQEMAVAAAVSDPRFPPLKLAELDRVRVEISVLSPLRPITDTGQIEVGKHGLLLTAEGRQGVFLPQVPVEQGWSRQEFLDNLCLKAGLPRDCWNKGSVLFAFTAVVLGE
jgi:hypothetical protein